MVDNGFAVLEIDMWKPRGVTSLNNRPPNPVDTLPDVWGAWHVLRNTPGINKNRIGIMGFSWGGVLALITAFNVMPKNAPNELWKASFNAHVAFYPVCSLWIDDGFGMKILDPYK